VLKLIVLTVLKTLSKKNKTILNKQRKAKSKLLRNLAFEPQDWSYTEANIYSNPNSNIIFSYYKFKDLAYPFTTFEKDSKIFLSFGSNYQKEIQPFRNIQEILKESPSSFYVCLQNSKRFYNINLSLIVSSSERLTEVFDDMNDSITRIVCGKSFGDKKLLIGYIGWNRIKIFDPSTKGYFLIYQNDKGIFLAINFIYPNNDESIEMLIFSKNIEDTEFYILRTIGNLGSYRTTSFLVNRLYSDSLLKSNILVSSTLDKRFAIVIAYDENETTFLIYLK